MRSGVRLIDVGMQMMPARRDFAFNYAYVYVSVYAAPPAVKFCERGGFFSCDESAIGGKELLVIWGLIKMSRDLITRGIMIF